MVAPGRDRFFARTNLFYMRDLSNTAVRNENGNFPCYIAYKTYLPLVISAYKSIEKRLTAPRSACFIISNFYGNTLRSLYIASHFQKSQNTFFFRNEALKSIISSLRVAHVTSERATGYGHFGNEGNLKVRGSASDWRTFHAAKCSQAQALKYSTTSLHVVPCFAYQICIRSLSTT
jgi:hypothetical protein